MTRDRRPGAFASAAGLALALMLASGGARADDPYHLLTGDVVAMSVAGFPDLTQKAEVQLDGSLNLPMVGEVRAAGRTLKDVRERIRSALANRLIPVYASDGQEHLRAVMRDQVSAWIAEYRPVFVSGDVVRSGEFRYRPGMTVRQAVAAAGGVMATPVATPAANTAGLEADYKGAWIALATTEARIWRLRTELGEDIAFDPSGLPPAPQEATALDDILRVEKQLRQARALDHERERAFLERGIEQINQQAKVLKRQLEVQKKTDLADAADLEKVTKLSDKGLITNTSMSDLRRAALISATMRLQTELNLMQLERRGTEVARDLERLDDNRQVSLLSELQQAQVKRAAEDAKLNALVSRLQAAGVALPEAAADGKITMNVMRAGAAGPIPALPDLELRPGDVVQVKLGAAAEGPTIGGPASEDSSRRMAANHG